jgi:antitoxin component of RelBE/YafQ-DinJ toxin-antitoxin module
MGKNASIKLRLEQSLKLDIQQAAKDSGLNVTAYITMVLTERVKADLAKASS